ncbi:FAD-binding protein [Mycolicibacterium goodii]|uniref:FAD-binding oxidoreductase n=1 Tax=Mycolicibacterium goodii TaxID=134601 RepID=UPI001F042ADE|nr:FAD-binding protein [Mycolicibacterium goodii]ULN50751.1 FAD-binding protein [Mycolicibacterium goodii]
MLNSSDRHPAQRTANAVSRRTFLAGSAAVAAISLLATPIASADDLSTLRRRLRGTVLLPGDAGFEDARKPWTLTIDQAVRAVVDVADVGDASALVGYARETGTSLSIQPTGHSATPAANGSILVRTRHLDEVRVDPERKIARVGAGVSWTQLHSLVAQGGLLALAGSAPGVGITGYTLGGGLSWFSRRYGWAAQSVRAIEGICADGARFRATTDSEPDLFWALRGGGGDYGLVTAIEFDLYPAPNMCGGSLRWPARHAPAVLAAFRETTNTAPEELAVWFNQSHFPGAPPLTGIDVMYLGEPAAARALLKPFAGIANRISDTLRPLRFDEIGTITNEPTAPGGGRQRATLLTTLTDDVIESFTAVSMTPLINIQIRHLGGALGRPSDTAAGPIKEPYLANLVGRGDTQTAVEAMQSRVATYLELLKPINSGRTPFTLLAPEQTAAQALPNDSISRLQTIKERRDPQRVFRSNYPVTD